MRITNSTKKSIMNAFISQQMLASIVETSDDAILSKDLDGIITSWNKAAELLYGYTPQEIIGKSVATLMPDQKKDDFITIMSTLRKGRQVKHYETIRMRKDGRLLDVSITVSPLKDGSGKIIGASTIARDITEKKRLDTLKENFILAASHELRTPLTSQRIYIQKLLQKIETHHPYEKMLTKIEDQNKRMTDLIEEMLLVLRLQSNTFAIHQSKMRIDKILEESLKKIAALQQTHKIEVKGLKKMYILGEEFWIKKALLHILANAIKFSPGAEKIIVEMKEDSSNIIILIQDYGIGIPHHEQEKIFDKFFRVSGENEQTFPGLGMGLYVASQVMKYMGGRITVNSKKGIGSTFSVIFPLVK